MFDKQAMINCVDCKYIALTPCLKPIKLCHTPVGNIMKLLKYLSYTVKQSAVNYIPICKAVVFIYL